MATLVVKTITRAGEDFTADAASAGVSGDNFVNDGTVFFVVDNGAGSNITVTLDLQATLDGQTASNRTVTVDAGHMALIGPFPPQWYNDNTNKCYVTYSSATSVTVLPVKLGS